jgi:tetratricopeptide (TPR) repeat protein
LLAGREKLLARLHSLLTQGERPTVVVLCGLGGVGKTSLAVECAHRHLAEVAVTWQVSAEDPAVLAAGLAQLAAQIGAQEIADLRDPVASAHAVLAAYPAQWLIVFDNAPDEASVRRFIPPAGRGWVLITSQSQHWPGRQVLDIGVLDLEVAAGFLIERTGDSDHPSAVALARELGGLPLALEQAAAYVGATGGDLAGYLAAFRERRPDLLARGEPAGYDKTTATTWDLAFARLERDNRNAVGVLRLLACCAPEPVPLRLLLSNVFNSPDNEFAPDVGPILQPLLSDALTVGDAVVALRRFSLITPSRDGLVLVHRLVQAVTLAQMSADLTSQWQQAAVSLIDAAIPADSSRPDMWSTFAVLLPHARVVLPPESKGMERIARYLRHAGDYRTARMVVEQVVEARRDLLGHEHPSTLRAKVEFASTLRALGELDAEFALLRRAIGPLENVLGKDHRTTLEARHSMALGLRDQHQWEAAASEFRTVLDLQRKSFGEDDVATLATRSALASLLRRQGQLDQAEAEYRAVLAARQRVLGDRHPDTLSTRHTLAYVLQVRGQARTAEAEYRAIIELQRETRGDEHPGTLGTRHNLASVLQDQGRWDQAEAEYRAVLAARQRVLGDRHPDTLSTRHALAYVLRTRT